MSKARVGQLTVALVGVTGPLERSLSTVEKRLEQMGKSVTRIGKTLTTRLTAPFTAAMGVATKFYSEQEKSERMLQSTLRITGNEVEGNMQRFKELADQLQSLTVVGDETTLMLIGMGLRLGISTDQMDDATRGAIGLSRAFDMDLNTSMQLIARAIQGDTTALQRYIPHLRSAETESERLAIINEVLSESFGFAVSETDTLQGSLTQLYNRFGDILERIGEAFLPILNQLIALIDTTITFAEGWTDESIRLAVMIGAVVASIGPLLIGIGLTITLLAKVIAVVKIAVAVVGSFAAMMASTAALIAGPIVAALGIALAGFLAFTQEGQKFLSFFTGGVLAKRIQAFGFGLVNQALRFGAAFLDEMNYRATQIGVLVREPLVRAGQAMGDRIFVLMQRAKIIALDIQGIFSKARREAAQQARKELDEAKKRIDQSNDARDSIMETVRAIERGTFFEDALEPLSADLEAGAKASRELADAMEESGEYNKGIFDNFGEHLGDTLDKFKNEFAYNLNTTSLDVDTEGMEINLQSENLEDSVENLSRSLGASSGVSTRQPAGSDLPPWAVDDKGRPKFDEDGNRIAPSAPKAPTPKDIARRRWEEEQEEQEDDSLTGRAAERASPGLSRRDRDRRDDDRDSSAGSPAAILADIYDILSKLDKGLSRN